MFRNAIWLCHFLSTVEEQKQAEIENNFWKMLFKAMLAEAVVKKEC